MSAAQGNLRWGFSTRHNQHVAESDAGFATGATPQQAAENLRQISGYHRPYVMPSSLLGSLMKKVGTPA